MTITIIHHFQVALRLLACPIIIFQGPYSIKPAWTKLLILACSMQLTCIEHAHTKLDKSMLAEIRRNVRLGLGEA